ncbi:MAG: DUF1572 family protein [Planctomycetota bacterium]
MSREIVETIEKRFRGLEQLGRRAWEQVDEAAFARTFGKDENSIVVLIQHVVGNLRSRFTDFLTTDGEKPWRHRDREFVESERSRSDLESEWSGAWEVLFGTLEPLADADLSRIVTIRSEPHTVLDALLRQLAHYGYHVGQIVQLSRHWCGDEWQTLSVPRGQSEAYNRKMFGQAEPK